MLALYTQNLDPLKNHIASTAFAALPVIVLFVVLVPMRKPAPLAALLGAVTAFVIAWCIYGMELQQAAWAFVHGAGFGLLPIGWTVLNAMLLYNVTVVTGQFAIVRRSVSGLSPDARVQAILVAFAFGAFLEGAAGAGSPVAICGAILAGLGFNPLRSAVLCLIANTSPVAFGGLSTPILTLATVTGIPAETLSAMAGRQLPFFSFIVPFWMVRCMCSWRQTWEVWPALVVTGGSFAIFQFAFSNAHIYVPGFALFPMTDVGGGIFALVITAGFLKFWQPRTPMVFAPPAAIAEAEHALPQLTARQVLTAWMPYALMSVLLVAGGLIRQREQATPERSLDIGPVQSNYQFPIPGLHEQVVRAPELREAGRDEQPEPAVFNLIWLTAPGSPVFAAAILSMLLLRMRPAEIGRAIWMTMRQMRIPLPTIAFMLGLSSISRYSGMDATLGVAIAATGFLYPFFAAILGWLGVFLTGTDAASNALFGSLQKITATRIHDSGAITSLSLPQAQVLICTANSTGGVMGKMIDAQSICVATAATDQVGREADIFRAVIWHSVVLASLIGLLTLGQVYLTPLTLMVPAP
jgi:lactate permease